MSDPNNPYGPTGGQTPPPTPPEPPRYAAPSASPYAAPAPGPVVVKQGRSTWAIVLTIMLVVMLGLCVISTLLNAGSGLGAGGFGPSDGVLTETHVDGDVDAEAVAVMIPIKGVIMEGGSGGGLFGAPTRDMLALTKQRIEKAVKRNARALVLEIDSPGGGVWASAWLHKLLVDTKAEHQIPIVALMKNVAASGGYYVAAPCDWIIAAPSTITGSIGVIMAHYDASELAQDKLGIKYEPFTSAPMKDTLSPMREVRPDERAHLNEMVQQMYDEFLDVVVSGRGGKVTREGVMALQSRIVTGVQAKAAGLIDELGYTENALAKAKELSGQESMRLVRYDPQPGFLDALMGANSEPTMTLPGGARISLEPAAASRQPFLYVWSGGL